MAPSGNAFASFCNHIAKQRGKAFRSTVDEAGEMWSNMDPETKAEWKVKARKVKEESKMSLALEAQFSKQRAKRIHNAQLEDEDKKNKLVRSRSSSYHYDSNEWIKKRQRDITLMSEYLTWVPLKGVVEFLQELPLWALGIEVYHPEISPDAFVPAEIVLAEFTLKSGVKCIHRYSVAIPDNCKETIKKWEDEGNQQPISFGVNRPIVDGNTPEYIIKRIANYCKDSKYIFFPSKEFNKIISAVEWMKSHSCLKSNEALTVDRFISLEDFSVAVADFANDRVSSNKTMEFNMSANKLSSSELCSTHRKVAEKSKIVPLCAKMKIKQAIFATVNVTKSVVTKSDAAMTKNSVEVWGQAHHQRVGKSKELVMECPGPRHSGRPTNIFPPEFAEDDAPPEIVEEEVNQTTDQDLSFGPVGESNPEAADQLMVSELSLNPTIHGPDRKQSMGTSMNVPLPPGAEEDDNVSSLGGFQFHPVSSNKQQQEQRQPVKGGYGDCPKNDWNNLTLAAEQFHIRQFTGESEVFQKFWNSINLPNTGDSNETEPAAKAGHSAPIKKDSLAQSAESPNSINKDVPANRTSVIHPEIAKRNKTCGSLPVRCRGIGRGIPAQRR